MKVPEPRKLPSGTWFIQMRLNGVSVPVSASTKKECIRQAQLIKAEHRAATRVIKPKSDKTLPQLIQEYIDALPPDTSESTIRGYTTIKNTRFLEVKDVPVGNIKDWQKIIDDELAKNISPKTIKNAWSLNKAAMRSAGLDIPDVRLPKLEPAAVKRKVEWLEADQILQFVPLLKDTHCEIPAMLALHGLRRSEILAMTYEKIDIKNKTIMVHGAAVLNKDGELVQRNRNKTDTSTRVIPIMIPELITAIKKVPAKQRHGLIYTGNPNQIYNDVNRICKKNGLPLVGVHGLRHSFASLAYHLGFSALETMELGGWSDYETMRKIYTHLAKKDRLAAENKMAKFYKDKVLNQASEKA